MPMYNPPHPGEILKEECLKPLHLTVTGVAAALGLSRKTLSAIINERQGITADVALRLAKAFGTTPDLWLGMQQDYDLWQARQRVDVKGVEVLYKPDKASRPVKRQKVA